MPPSRTYPPEAGAGPHPSPRMRRRPSTHSRGMVTIRRPVRTVAGKGGIRVTKQIDVLTTVEVADPAARRVRRTPSPPPPRRSDRVARGLATRREIPLESHAVLDTSPLRADPVELLERQAASRVPELVPIRYGRMLVSPFTFYRGAALIMAADLAGTPRSGITTQVCGDAHLMNFGAFASPERRLEFGINDFDETCPGPWEWDVKRLAASFEIMGRDRGFSPADRSAIVMAGVA